MRNKYLFIGLLIIIGICVYANTFQGDFVWDDQHLIVNNVFVKDWSNLGKVFTTNFHHFDFGSSNFYRPLVAVSLMTNYSLGKLNVFGYHLVNLLFHLANAFLIWWLVKIILKDDEKEGERYDLIAGLCALVFLIHPLQVNAISYIAGRPTLMGGFFALASLAFFIKYQKTTRISYYVLTIIMFLLGLISKETAVLIPFSFLAYHLIFCKRDRKSFLIYILLVIIIIIYTVSRHTIFDFSKGITSTSVICNMPCRVATFLKSLLVYYRLMFMPLDLQMERTIQPAKFFFEGLASFSLGILVLYSALLYFYRKHKSLIFFTGFFFINLLPYAGIFPLNAFIAEHWLYLSLPGFFFIVFSVVTQPLRIKFVNIARWVLIVLFFTFFMLVTITYNTVWKDEIALYNYVLKYTPGSIRVRSNLGAIYFARGMFDEAIRILENAAKIAPTHAEVHNNLGACYHRVGRIKDGILSYQRAIALRPDYSEALNNLGGALLTVGRVDEAIEYSTRATQVGIGYNKEAYYNLGIGYQLKREWDKSIESFRSSLQIDPDYKDAHYQLVRTLNAAKRYEEGTREWQEYQKKYKALAK